MADARIGLALSGEEVKMKSSVDRQTVDLSAFPDLVVIYLGMRVRTLRGIKTLLGLGPQIDRAGVGRPEGLLHFENNIIFSLFPLHLGIRWYWRDFESMERWTRSEPHRVWWQNFYGIREGLVFGMRLISCAVHDLQADALSCAAFREW
jgi:hypothetical protein